MQKNTECWYIHKKITLKMEENSAAAVVVREKSPTLKMQAQ